MGKQKLTASVHEHIDLFERVDSTHKPFLTLNHQKKQINANKYLLIFIGIPRGATTGGSKGARAPSHRQ